VTAQVPTLVKEAVRELQKKHNFKVMEALSSFTTVAETRELGDVPSNFKEFRNRPYELLSTGFHRELQIATDRKVAEETWGSADAEAEAETLMGQPEMILMGEPSDDDGTMVYEVFPYSDSASLWEDSDAGEYRVRIPYWKYLTVLSASDDTNWFTVNADTYIVYKAASEGFFDNWDEERGTLWLQKAQAQWTEVLNADKRLRLSGVTHLVPNPDARRPRPIR